MIVLIGPSACGKTEVAKALSKYGIKKITTYTTRALREGEVDGVDYHFLSKEKFEELLKVDFFYEHAIYNDNYYGTCTADLVDNKVLIVEPQGLKSLQKNNISLYSIYIDVDDETRKIRMINRGDSAKNIETRLKSDCLVFDKNTIDVDKIVSSKDTTVIELTSTVYELYKNNYLKKNY